MVASMEAMTKEELAQKVVELQQGLAELSLLELANHRADLASRARKLAQREAEFDRKTEELDCVHTARGQALARRAMDLERRVEDVVQRELAVAAKEEALDQALGRRETDPERRVEDLMQREMALAANEEALAKQDFLLHAAGQRSEAGGGAQPLDGLLEILESPDIKDRPDIKASVTPMMAPSMRTPTPARSLAHSHVEGGGAAGTAAAGAGGTGGDAAPPLPPQSPKAPAAPAVMPTLVPRLSGAGVAAAYAAAVSHAKPSPPPRARRLSGPVQGNASKIRAFFEQRASMGRQQAPPALGSVGRLSKGGGAGLIARSARRSAPPAPPAPEPAAAPAPKVSMNELLARNEAAATAAHSASAADAAAAVASAMAATTVLDAGDSVAASDAASSMPESPADSRPLPAAAGAPTVPLDGIWGHDEASLYS